MAQGLLIAILGLWLILQGIAGDLPGRLMSYGKQPEQISISDPRYDLIHPKAKDTPNDDPGGKYWVYIETPGPNGTIKQWAPRF